MTRKHIFTAGPCLLPQRVYDDAVAALGNFAGTGVPVLSVSHRSREWVELMDETRALWRELLNIPAGYEVVFMAGGASMQFLCVAANLLRTKAGYVNSGIWAGKALKEAQGFGNACEIASSADRNFSYVPRGYEIPAGLDYLHITSNNTVFGTQLREDMDCPVPLVADMSSDILSRPVDVSKYALIYGGAQKNAGTAGVGFAIVNPGILGKTGRHIPSMLDYRVQIDNGSMFNTPPVFSIFIMNRTLHWIKDSGGVCALQKLNRAKADALYAEVDRNPLFRGTACPQDRSLMNVTFDMASGYEALLDSFVDFAQGRDIVGIKGHRLAGGLRASIYNACTMEDVLALTDCMKEFEKKNG
ncbi:MAG: 3-phosphoserine/phosphohydroxythreonine transaminase [Bacteroidales bacterium]|nr:3-phosphoserine/phosphohydroxythreonine transaminase [Bacteroidales bacterium]